MHSTEQRLNELVLHLHTLARSMEPSINGSKVRLLGDQLSVIGREYHEEMERTKMYDTSKFVTGL